MYTTKGDVRGCCDHKHRNLSTAVACLKKDRSGCKSVGGYSDRKVVRCDGEKMSDDEQNLLDAILYTER